MCDRLQMGTAGTSNAEQTDCTKKVIGFDSYNLSATGDIGRTLATPSGGLNEHIPVIFTVKRGDGMSINNAEKPVYALKIRGGVEVDSRGKKAGKGPLIRENQSLTLGVSQDQTLFVPKPEIPKGGHYSIDEKMGNTYIWEEQANTLASRDYKQPQAVLVRKHET